MDGRSSNKKVHWNIRWAFCFLLFTTCQGMITDREVAARSVGSMGALQRDMKMVGDITICTGLKRYIACLEGSNLAITKAFWGRISDKVCPSDDGDPVTDCDGSEDTLPLVKGYCEGKRECSLEARHTLLQKNGTHHCPGVNKYLIVNYTCIPESKSVTLCDSAETTLMCEAGWNIDVADVFWGRRSHAKYCGAEEGMECDSSDYAAKYIRGMCEGKKKCLVKADQPSLDNGHSPCTSVLKYLMINYICKPPERDVEDEEEKVANKLLEDPSSKELMGLLENHLSEMKPEIKQNAQNLQKVVRTDQSQRDSKASQREAAEERRVAPQRKVNYNTNTNANTNTNTNTNRATSRDVMGRVDIPPMIATEEDDLTDALIDTSSLDGSVKKQEVPEYNKDSKRTDTPTFQIPISKQQKKNETPSGSEDKEQKVLSDVNAKAKDTIIKPKEETFDATFTEPTTVRSILARAKEVLKTLDSDAGIAKSEKNIEKREGITHKTNNTSDASALVSATEEAAATVAELAKNLADNSASVRSLPENKTTTVTVTAIRKNVIQQAAHAAIQRPKPGIRKASLVPTGLGVAGIGNTP